jgi:hypothetical protein
LVSIADFFDAFWLDGDALDQNWLFAGLNLVFGQELLEQGVIDALLL